MAKKVLEQKLDKAVGAITVDDYDNLIDLVQAKMKGYKQFSAQWSSWATLKKKLEKKQANLLKKQNKKEPKAKKPVSWWCMSCNKEHSKAERVMKCPECGSEDIKRMDEYMAEQARGIAA